MIALYNFMFFLQVGQGQPAPGGGGAVEEGAKQAGEAAGQQAMPCGGGGDMTSFIIWMAVLFGMMYFLLIRPQKKQRQQQEQMLSAIQKGDRVVTTGGVLGTVRGLTDRIATLEVADGVNIRIRKEHIAGLQADPKEEAKGGKK